MEHEDRIKKDFELWLTNNKNNTVFKSDRLVNAITKVSDYCVENGILSHSLWLIAKENELDHCLSSIYSSSLKSDNPNTYYIFLAAVPNYKRFLQQYLVSDTEPIISPETKQQLKLPDVLIEELLDSINYGNKKFASLIAKVIFHEGFLTIEDINKLCDNQYCREQFSSSFPILKKINTLRDINPQFEKYGQNRYYLSLIS